MFQTHISASENANKVLRGCTSFNVVQFKSPKHLRDVSAQNYLFFLVSSVCLTGDVGDPAFSLCGKEGQRGMAFAGAPSGTSRCTPRCSWWGEL